MSNVKIMNERLITEAARDSEIDLDAARRFMACYYKRIREELNMGSTVITPLGNLSVTIRNLNTNLSDKKRTHKLVYKINKDYQGFLDKGVN